MSIKKVLVASLLAVSTLLTTGSQAKAADFVTVCEHKDYGGRCLNLGNRVADYRRYSFNDKASSLCNWTGYRVAFAKDINYRNNLLVVAPYTCIRDLRPWGFNDVISSHIW